MVQGDDFTKINTPMVFPPVTKASATSVTLGNGAVFAITGTTTITYLSKGIAGQVIVLLFSTSLTVTHNGGAPGGAFANILLSGAANFSATANDTLMLIYDGTAWRGLTAGVNI
jgi:hypothetical protein